MLTLTDLAAPFIYLSSTLVMSYSFCHLYCSSSTTCIPMSSFYLKMLWYSSSSPQRSFPCFLVNPMLSVVSSSTPLFLSPLFLFVFRFRNLLFLHHKCSGSKVFEKMNLGVKWRCGGRSGLSLKPWRLSAQNKDMRGRVIFPSTTPFCAI